MTAKNTLVPMIQVKIDILNKHHPFHRKMQGSPGVFYIGRGSALGNPYTVDDYGRDGAIAHYKTWLKAKIDGDDPRVAEALNLIASAAIHTTNGASLLCFCVPQPCHGNHIRSVILDAYSKLWDASPRIQCKCKCGHRSKWDGKCSNCRSNREQQTIDKFVSEMYRWL